MSGLEHPVALLRLREHLSLEDLAAQSGVPAPTILAIEACEVSLSPRVAEQLAPPLGVVSATLLASSSRFEREGLR